MLLSFPAFESGRLAGLGPRSHRRRLRRLASAWAPYAGQQEPQNFPYYYRWQFTHRRSRRLPLSGQPAQAAAGRSHGRHARLRCHGSRLESSRHRQARPERHSASGRSARGSRCRPQRPPTRPTRDRYENWDQPYPDSFEVSLAKFINLRRRLRDADAGRRQRRQRDHASTAGIRSPSFRIMPTIPIR